MTNEMRKYIPDADIFLFNTGEAQTAYDLFGCHYISDLKMHCFCVWAPNARAVSLVGDFNDWDHTKTPLEFYKNGAWVAFVPGLQDGDNYKYYVHGYDGSRVLKADPFAFHSETRPGNASKVWDIGGYEWHDGAFIEKRMHTNPLKSPVSIYEVHLGSWRTKDGYGFPSYRELADELSEYVEEMGYTHVELLPVSEYPFDGSWGYQVTGFYSVTSRYGTPQDFMYFVDKMHAKGIGVILDWVPAHFPRDEHGLAHFDGTWLYEHDAAIQREHPQWGTYIFNYGRPEVQSFLVSNAVFLMEKYHVDGLRVDAVTSMLYLDYARDGVYMPNEEGGNIDLGAVEFLKKVNSVVLTKYAGTITIAEESTAYPMVTQPPSLGGLGFIFKWNMGFMHDTLKYMSMDHYFRQFEHSKMTFSLMYTFNENYILAYSHDEVVHGKLSMIGKMYGDYWQKFASLRTLFGFMYAHPGKKLMFMGDEFAQFIEWDYKKQLDWFLLEYDSHKGMRKYVKALNRLYRETPALYEVDEGWDGFEWLNVDDSDTSVFAFMRMGTDSNMLCVANFTPLVRDNYPVAMPGEGKLKLVLSSDDEKYGGSGVSPDKTLQAVPMEIKGKGFGVRMTLPPLSVLYFHFEPSTRKQNRRGRHDK